eukprot:CAMPEP_0116848716 /NCGR_PEP_ID=MMETSP0418-20121206/15163_1 /TAXON_ID=1158023 /ORGANISM="Astrosyne radiata, Strain 13vi08-1A" /LENGTH=221 /DNA_ID=CAMNT_0004480341 /DNA_START=152 /DNA_END=817 /DNA_ORIENTATION=+
MRGELPKEVEKLGEQLASLQVRVHNIQEEISHLEQEIASQRIHIKALEVLVKRYEKQQMNVRNNREYDAITKEIDLQKLELQLAEKKIRDTYGRIEEKKLTLEQIQESIEKDQQVLADKKGALQGVIAESQEEERKLHEQRKSVIRNVDVGLLSMYDRIRKNVHNNLTVVAVCRGACGGCFNEVPPQTKADIQEKKSIIVCEHCGRILADVINTTEEGEGQ